MQKTNNYGLNKPDKEDFYNIEDFNENTEIIDDVLGKKVDVEEGKTLSDNNFTNELKEKLEQASENKHSHTNKSVLDKITQALLNAWNNAVEHINDSIKHITADERNLWNTVKNKADSGHTHDERYYTESEIDNKLSGKAAANHTHDYIATSASCNKNWNWYGYEGQPQWLWGGDDGANMYVYNPSNFNVNYANTTHALRTYGANGISHGGTGWLLKCQHDVDGDGLFKIFVGDKDIGTKVDRASWANGANASNVTIADAAGYFSANNAEGALAEIWAAVKYPNQTIMGAVNWNNYMVNGVYKIQNCTMTSTYNAPVGVYGFGILVVIHPEQGGESRCYQIYIPHNSENVYYIRSYNNSWAAWRCSTDHTHSYLPLSGGTVSGNLAVTGNVEATGTIKGSAIYNALWGADYAETFDFEGEQPEVGEIVEIYDKRKLRKAEENSRKVIGIVSNTYCILAGSDEKEVENGTKIAVGLLGQLPIKIIGKVEAGDFIISAGKGIGKIADENVVRGSIIGRALESNSEKNIKMVYCLIQPQ